MQQDIFVTQNLRQLAEALAKAKVAFTLGIGVAQTEPFIKAGLPLKSLPELREGSPRATVTAAWRYSRTRPIPTLRRFL